MEESGSVRLFELLLELRLSGLETISSSLIVSAETPSLIA
jgi:hypothetical protein